MRCEAKGDSRAQTQAAKAGRKAKAPESRLEPRARLEDDLAGVRALEKCSRVASSRFVLEDAAHHIEPCAGIATHTVFLRRDANPGPSLK